MREIRSIIPHLALQPSEALARVVLRRRLALGLTQAEVAERSGLDTTAVQGIETGRVNPTIQAVWLLAAALETSVGALAGWAEKEVEAAGPAQTRAPRRSTG